MTPVVPQQYPPVHVSVLAVTLVGDTVVGLLTRPRSTPTASWVLPTRPLGANDRLETVARALAGELGVQQIGDLSQVGAFQSGGDDGELMVCFTVATTERSIDTSMSIDERLERALVPVETILEPGFPVGEFDLGVVERCFEHLGDRLELAGVAPKFLDSPFSLPRLRAVYEGVWGEELNAANFRRSVTARTSAPVPSTDKLHEIFSRAVTFQALEHLRAESGAPTHQWPAVAERSPLALRVFTRENAAVTTSEPADPSFLVHAGEAAPEGGRGGRRVDLYRATSAWDTLPPPVRRPRRRFGSGTRGHGR